ncbi:MAG: hypothetical protein CVV07_02745 [Gammaproteobacteria bacterium HGW-Gammaproteobacteria-11]|nr:MAG: hypothetical protein CVV07_02745 [Gammaproteobacteria bacterium HGW-Gammaproteobacteria-11]
MNTKTTTLILTICLLITPVSTLTAATPEFGTALTDTVAFIEATTGGRVGVSITDLDSGLTWSHRSNERFPMASTFKAFSCAHLLALADKGEIDLDSRVQFEESDLQDYSPITQHRVGGNGMTLFELCAASTSLSDNTAANLTLQNTGGPPAFTQFMRSIGDNTTRLDRYEPDLNYVGPGEEQDTTSPASAAKSLQTLLLGNSLSNNSREQLKTWLINNEVGGPLLRASLPDGWQIADRTGAGGYGTRGIVAVIWPQGSAATTHGPVVAAVYLTGTTLTLEERNAAIADIGRALVEDLGVVE